MPWKNQTGGKGGGPWGGGPGGPDGDGGDGGNGKGDGPWGAGGPRRGGSQPPNFEDMIRRGQDNVKRVLPGGIGGPRGIILIALAALLIWLSTGIYRVNPEQAGAELVFGKLVNVTSQGLHYNWPSPIGAVYRPNVTRQNITNVGFIAVGQGAGRQTRDVAQESLMLTGDENIIDIHAVVFWKVDLRPNAKKPNKGLRNFLFNIRNPERTVKDATESALREIIGKSEFEFIRTQGRVRIQQEARALIQRILDDYGAGVHVTRLQLAKIDPPGIVLDAFKDVQAARADKEKVINQANAYFNRVVQQAEGVAEQIVKAGEGYKEEKIAIATGEASRFLAVYSQYLKEKVVTRRRIYIETMRDVLKGMDKILIDSKGRGTGVVPYLPLNELKRSPPSTPSTTTNDGRT